MLKSRKERLLALGLGALALLLITEVALRIVGSFYPTLDPLREVPLIRAGCPSCPRILCMGDSYTYGIGASSGQDYPRQLQVLLGKDRPDTPFLVFNGGLAGANTSFVLQALPKYLEAVRPDIVTVLAGGSNNVNLFGYVAYRKGCSIRSAAESFLYHVRVARLVSFFAARLGEKHRALAEDNTSVAGGLTDDYIKWHHNSKQRGPLSAYFQRGCSLLNFGSNEEAIDSFKGGVTRYPQDSSHYWGIGLALRGMRRFDEARRWFEKAIEADPSDPNAYYEIGELFHDQLLLDPEMVAWYQRGIEADPAFAPNYFGLGSSYLRLEHNTDEALRWFRKGIEVDPYDSNTYSALVMLGHDPGIRGEVEKILRELAPDREAATAYLEILNTSRREEEIQSWVRSDLEAIVHLAASRGAKVVLQSYPLAMPVNSTLSDYAGRAGLPFVDHASVFESLLAEGTARESLYSRDGHCNDRGYGVMAENLRKKILEVAPR